MAAFVMDTQRKFKAKLKGKDKHVLKMRVCV